MALGTRVLGTKSPGFSSRLPAPVPQPQAAYRRPVRSGNGDAHHVPTPPNVVHANNVDPAGRSKLDHVTPLPLPPVPPVAHFMAPPAAPSPYDSHSPNEEYMPILHQSVPKFGRTTAKTPVLVIVPPPPASNTAGITPVTPSPSPRYKAFKRIRASQLPRDALGIAHVPFTWRKSQCAVDDDTTPVTTPSYVGSPVDGHLTVKTKPRRKTIFDVLDGWWDLGLLKGTGVREEKAR